LQAGRNDKLKVIELSACLLCIFFDDVGVYYLKIMTRYFEDLHNCHFLYFWSTKDAPYVTV